MQHDLEIARRVVTELIKPDHHEVGPGIVPPDHAGIAVGIGKMFLDPRSAPGVTEHIRDLIDAKTGRGWIVDPRRHRLEGDIGEPLHVVEQVVTLARIVEQLERPADRTGARFSLVGRFTLRIGAARTPDRGQQPARNHEFTDLHLDPDQQVVRGRKINQLLDRDRNQIAGAVTHNGLDSI